MNEYVQINKTVKNASKTLKTEKFHLREQLLCMAFCRLTCDSNAPAHMVLVTDSRGLLDVSVVC